MSCIYLIHDFSPSRVWLYAFLESNRQRLAKRNIVLAPFNSWASESPRSHYILWETWFRGKPLPKHLVSQYKSIGDALNTGRDVLLFSHALAQDQHDFFWQNLGNLSTLAGHALRAFFVLGSPGFLLENYYREVSWAAPKDASWLYKLIAAIPALIASFSQRPGAETCVIAGNKAQAAHSAPDEEVAERLCQFLDCALDHDVPVPMHPLAYRSNMIRRIQAALEVRENSWPFMDMANLNHALLKADPVFSVDYLSPVGARRKFSYGVIEKKFGKICSLPPLSAPPKFYDKNPIDKNAPLLDGAVSKFLTFLGDSRSTLHARLKNDERLLSADQKALLGCLEKYAASDEFKKVEVCGTPVTLTVLTMTYNHERFIRKCLDSVLMQITDFPVQHIVLDHHSDDATPAIVAEYAAKYPAIRPVLLSQRRWGENVRGLFSRCNSKYAALCDGDDYFLDPSKLQRQVEYLEKRPDYSFCFHLVASVFEDGRPASIFPPMRLIPKKKNNEYDLEDLAKGNFIQTNSVVYRWRFRDGLPDWFDGTLMPGDWYWHMLHAETGMFGYIPRIMSAYRRHPEALYEAASRSSEDLRRAVGMDELQAYRAYRDHFGKRLQGVFEKHAQNVLQDFAIISKIDGNRSLLDGALKAFPEFASQFAAES